MREKRSIGQNRCYHLINRLSHRAFFLDDEENDLAVTLMRRVRIDTWEAGIAERPEDYRWCSFAAAVCGDMKARAGYAFMNGGERADPDNPLSPMKECNPK